MREIVKNLNGKSFSIGIVMSEFNPHVGEALFKACQHELLNLGVADDHIVLAKVPGVLEAPLALQKMAQSKKFSALIAIGAVIRGETFHFEVVANHSAKSIMDVQLAFNIPIVNAILTTDNDDQAMERTSIKGKEAAQVAIQMIHLLKSI
ncbi:MAG: 6,7-dimethyl-8-ribityllumazine synthase [Candidatus Methylopumilus sp.]|nr:6,7-dimethyl-8-ribityllumazine synthase [Candidatus Methylopumilus sp.]